MRRVLQQWPTLLAGMLLITGTGAAVISSPLEGSATLVRAYPASEDLEGHWTLDVSSIIAGSASDSSSSNITASIVRPATTTAGRLKEALYFDGTQHLEVPIATAYDQITVSAWIKPASLTGSNPRIVANSHTDSAEQKGFQLLFHSGGASGFFDVGNGTLEGRAEWHQQLYVGRWYHYVGTYDGESVRAYLNGVEVASSTFAGGAISAPPRDVNIGRNPYYGDDYFRGTIDDVRIYSRALSATEIENLFDLRSATMNVPQNDQYDFNRIALWTFDGPDMDWGAATTSDPSGIVYSDLTGFSQRTAAVPGKRGQALFFDGVDDCVESNLVMINPAAFTLMGWIYPASYAASGFFGQNDVIEFGMRGDGRMGAWSGRAGDINWTIDPGVLPLNHWHHVAYAGNGSTHSLYVDGEEVVSASADGPGPSAGSMFNVGGCGIWTSSGDYFRGKIDDVRVYNGMLSDDEIHAIYLLNS